MPIPMQVTPGTIPTGFCPSSEQQRFNLYASLLSVTFPLSASLFNFGNTVPIPDQQSFPWIRTNSDGTLDGLYVYANGSWVRPHSIPANSPVLFPYNGSLASIDTYDGGESGAVTSDSGPMWKVATNDGAAPASDGSNVIAYGQMLVGYSTDFPQGASGGEINHTLVLPEIPAHVHPAARGLFLENFGSGGQSSGSASTQNTDPNTGYAGGNGTTTDTPGPTVGHNNMPPYFSIYWISRTSRIFYRAS